MRYSVTGQKVPGSIHGRVLGIFPSDTLILSAGSSSGVHSASKTPHKRSVLPSVLTAQLITAQLDRECVVKSVGLCS